jgi:hypothetical protein
MDLHADKTDKILWRLVKHTMQRRNSSMLKMMMERVVIAMEKAAVAVATIDFNLCLHICLN